MEAEELHHSLSAINQSNPMKILDVTEQLLNALKYCLLSVTIKNQSLVKNFIKQTMTIHFNVTFDL